MDYTKLNNGISIEEFCQILAQKSGFSYRDIYNMELHEIYRLTYKYFKKNVLITFIDMTNEN